MEQVASAQTCNSTVCMNGTTMTLDFCVTADIWTVVLVLVATNVVVLLVMLMRAYRGTSNVIRDTEHANVASGHIHPAQIHHSGQANVAGGHIRPAQIHHNGMKWNRKKKKKRLTMYTGCGHIVRNN